MPLLCAALDLDATWRAPDLPPIARDDGFGKRDHGLVPQRRARRREAEEAPCRELTYRPDRCPEDDRRKTARRARRRWSSASRSSSAMRTT
jgi:hypothetical protein